MLEAITEALKAETALKPQFPNDNGGQPFVILKDGESQVAESLQHLCPTPLDSAGTAKLHDLDSFIGYVNDRKNEDSRIFVDLHAAEFVAVLDFHADILPQWCRDIAEFDAKKKTEWRTWVEKNTLSIPQATFAEFLEDNIQNIVEPDAAQLIEVAKNLVAKKTVNFRSGINLENGDVQLQYEETTAAKSGAQGSMVIPSEIKLALQPFEGAPAYSVSARLRYRINEGVLTFAYRLRQHDKVWEDAVKEAVAAVAEKTQLPVVLGTYERG